MAKNLFVVNFVFPHKCYTEFSWSYTEKQAYWVCVRRVAKKQGVSLSEVVNYFKANPGSVKIQIENEMED